MWHEGETDNEKTAIVNAIVKDINFVNPLINGGK